MIENYYPAIFAILALFTVFGITTIMKAFKPYKLKPNETTNKSEVYKSVSLDATKKALTGYTCSSMMFYRGTNEEERTKR